MSRFSLRSDSLLFSIADLHIYRQEELQYRDKIVQLPTYKFVVEKFYTISKYIHNIQGGVDESVNRVVKKLEEIWIYCNVYPLSHTTTKKKVNSIVNDVKNL